MTRKKALSFEELQSTAKTRAQITDDECNYSCRLDNKKYPKPNREELFVSLGLVQRLREQWKDLIDNIPMDMQKVRDNYEVYSVGTKKQWVDWFVRYNQVLGAEGLREVLGSEKEDNKKEGDEK